MVYPGGVYSLLYTLWYTLGGVYSLVCLPMYTRVVYIAWYASLVHSWVWYTLYIPGYTMVTPVPCCTSVVQLVTLRCTVRWSWALTWV